MKALKTIVCCIVIAALSGCILWEKATTPKPSAQLAAVQTLEIARAFYTETLQIMGTLHSQGKLTDQQVIRIIAASDKYREIYLAAVPVVQAYAGGTGNQQMSEEQISALSVAALELAATVADISGVHIPLPDALKQAATVAIPEPQSN